MGKKKGGEVEDFGEKSTGKGDVWSTEKVSISISPKKPSDNRGGGGEESAGLATNLMKGVFLTLQGGGFAITKKKKFEGKREDG